MYMYMYLYIYAFCIAKTSAPVVFLWTLAKSRFLHISTQKQHGVHHDSSQYAGPCGNECLSTVVSPIGKTLFMRGIDIVLQRSE
jgi:hypothetical protein